MTTHSDWAARGFGHALVPIIPPRAPLAPRSQDLATERGKVPGLRRRDGAWHGYDWRGEAPPAPADMDAWGASVGLRGEVCTGVDIDVSNAVAAELMAAAALQAVPGGVPRVGRAPRVLLAYRAAADAPRKRVVRFRLPDDTVHKVELLGAGQQWVADGEHPATGAPYAWPEGRPTALGALPEMGTAEADLVMAAVEGVIDMLGGTVLGRSTGGDDHGPVDPATLLAPDEEALAEAVAHLVPDGSREWWVRCGMAIKAAGGTVEQWQDVSDRWDGPPEDPADLERRWAGFRNMRSGWGWIEAQARDGGWLGSALRDFAGVEVAPQEAIVPADETIQQAMFRRYVWVEAIERIADTASRALLTRTQFNVRLAEIGPPSSATKCAWAVFTGDERARRVAAVTYRPGAGVVVDEDGAPAFNTWRPSRLRPRPGATDEDVRPWLDLAERVLPDPRERGWFLDWLASLIQHPGVKPAFGVVLGGAQGIGKDSLVAPVIAALGQHNVQAITVEVLNGAQTYWCESAQLVVVTEMHSFSRREMGDKLKGILAAPPMTLPVNKKYLPQYDVPNIVAALLMTNHLDALAIEDSDRRLLCLWSPHPNINRLGEAEQSALAEGFRAFYAWRAQGGDEAVAGWLLRRDLAAFRKLTRAPDTAAKAEMRTAGRSEAAATLEDAMEAMDLPDLVSPGDLAARLSAGLGRGEKGVSGHAVARVLRSMGAVQMTKESVAVPPTATVTGAKRVRIWALRNETTYSPLPDAALARQYAEMWGATKQELQSFFAPHLAGDFPASENG